MTQTGNDGLYALLFESAYVSTPAGGNVLAQKLNRSELEGVEQPIAESWEICDNEEHESIVLNGPLQGRSLHSLLEEFGPALAGRKYSSGRFPLEVKIINAQKKLPLQVQPSAGNVSAIAGAVAGSRFWYILSAEKGAKIMAGIQAASSRMRFMESFRENQPEKQMQIFDSFANDAYYIPGGKLHSIGAGNLILEISRGQSSTYTLENPQDPEAEKTISCVDFTDRTVSRISGASDLVARNRKFPVINRCAYFQAEELLLVSDWHDSTLPGTSFHILSAVKGAFSVSMGTDPVFVREGSSCLIPASCGNYTILPQTGENTQCRIIKTSLSSL